MAYYVPVFDTVGCLKLRDKRGAEVPEVSYISYLKYWSELGGKPQQGGELLPSLKIATCCLPYQKLK